MIEASSQNSSTQLPQSAQSAVSGPIDCTSIPEGSASIRRLIMAMPVRKSCFFKAHVGVV